MSKYTKLQRNVYMPDVIWEPLKELAATRGVSIAAIIRESLDGVVGFREAVRTYKYGLSQAKEREAVLRLMEGR